MTQLRIQMDMNNAAFDPENGAEAARILRELADKVEAIEYLHPTAVGSTLRDINGNTVGDWEVTS